ncbi:hypothetical protein [Pontibacter anaerobius]
MSVEEFGSDIKDIQIQFNKDGSYIHFGEGEEIGNGTWEFTADENSIIQDKGSEDEYVFDINKLTSSELYFETEEVISDELTDIVEYRFNR